MDTLSTEIINAADPEAQVFADVRLRNTAAGQAVTAAGQAVASTATASPPPKADAAPKTSKVNTFVGLMEALNKFEQGLVPNTFEVANEYSIEFAPETLANSKVLRPGKSKKTTPMQQGTTASAQKDPETQSTNYTARNWSIAAGTPIVQLIDLVMRNSSYITDQAVVKINETTQKTETQVPIGGMTWYKINVETSPIKYDNKRKDYAYKIKFVISTYAINSMLSDYFPEGRFRGVHKSYNFWFTGQNTQVLNFEQEFNKLYKQTISDPNIAIAAQQATNNREIVPRMYQAASEQSSQGAENKTNEISANAADYLYSPADQGNVRLKIIGDPAWLQQGEVSTGVSARTFSFAPFNTDGTINFDAGEIVFDISWNRAVDYNMSTGLMDTGANNYNGDRSAGKAGDAKENITYRAVKCRSSFRQGKFEQELEGKLFLVPVNKQADQGRPTNQTPTGATPVATVGEGVLQAQSASGTVSTEFTNTRQPNLLSPAVADLQSAGNRPPDADPNTASGSSDSAPLPAAENSEPTSNGQVVGRPQINAEVLTAQGVSSSDPQTINREF